MTKTFKILNPLKILQKSRQQAAEQRKIKQQEELIQALKSEPNRRPAAKFASNRTRGTGPG
jgi:hypothetical protein